MGDLISNSLFRKEKYFLNLADTNKEDSVNLFMDKG